MDAGSEEPAYMTTNPESRIPNPDLFYPSTCLAIVTSCMFEVPS